MDDLLIKPMSLEDFGKIKNSFSFDFDEYWNPNILEDELKSISSKFIVAIYKDEIIGFAGFKILFDYADIMNICVKKNYRNRGFGTFLLKSLISLFESLDLDSLNLEVNENNLNAIKLYQKFGFEQISIRKNYYSNCENAIIMKLSK